MNRLVLFIGLAACDSGLDQRLAIVTAPRVLAITSEPPEAKPGASVTYAALVGSPTGPVATAPRWALCTAPKPPTEDNAVSDACLADQVIDLGATPIVTAMLPADGCILFGPDVPPGGFRPRDPDPTGGYYQPVRADATGAYIAFGFSRITCNLPGASGDVAHDYQTNYVANRNPVLAPLAIPTSIAADTDVTLTASWDEPESYLYYDPQTQTLVVRREAMRISWFATAGELPVDATAVSETDPATSASIRWHAPSTPGPAWIWLVLRDSRGGIATQTIAITIR
jgi:hypothetical protein